MKYRALVMTEATTPFHLWWKGGRVVSNATSQIAKRAADYLNGEPLIGRSQANEGGTDSHWVEPGKLETEDDFLLTVGSLVDHVDGIQAVELVK